MKEPPQAPWEALDARALARLRAERLETHWVAQLFWATGNALSERRADDSHTSFSWSPARDAFLGGPTPSGIRVALGTDRIAHVLRGQGGVVDSLPLSGHTLREALDAVRAAIAREVGEVLPLEIPGYDLPEHPVGEGARIREADPALAGELARWFGNVHGVLDRVRRENAGATPVRIWPHHFDIATLIALDPDAEDAETARSINVGLSPGDSTLPDPYFYVTPWPPPEGADPPPLPDGAIWQTEGWFGAVLPAAAVVSVEGAAAQEALVTGFLSDALPAARGLLLP